MPAPPISSGISASESHQPWIFFATSPRCQETVAKCGKTSRKPTEFLVMSGFGTNFPWTVGWNCVNHCRFSFTVVKQCPKLRLAVHLSQQPLVELRSTPVRRGHVAAQPREEGVATGRRIQETQGELQGQARRLWHILGWAGERGTPSYVAWGCMG